MIEWQQGNLLIQKSGNYYNVWDYDHKKQYTSINQDQLNQLLRR